MHPVREERVMAGNGTIGLELAEELPDADAVVVPWGGGGLFTGIASALAALRPEMKVWAAEPETAAAVSAALAAGAPADADFTPRSSTEPAPGWSCPICGSGPGRCSQVPSPSRSAIRPPCASSQSAHASSRRAPGRSRSRRSRPHPGPQARLHRLRRNIDSDRLAAILRGETPT